MNLDSYKQIFIEFNQTDKKSKGIYILYTL